MKLFAFACALFLANFSRAAEIDSAAFSRTFESYRSGEHKLSKELRREAKNYRFVFVGGLITEGSPFYLKDNIQALKDAGVPADQIHTLFPESGISIDDNAQLLTKQIPELNPDGKKLVLIGHSKGAAELLAATLLDPKLARDASEIFLVQGAYGGSGVIDHVLGVGRPVDAKVPLTLRPCLIAAELAGKFAVYDQGLASLRTETAHWYWKSLLKTKAKAAREVSPKVHYVRTWMEAEKASEALKCPTWYMETAYGKTDGIHLYDEQLVKDLGQDLMSLNVDHADLMNTKPLSRLDSSIRRAFMWTILETVQKSTEAKSSSETAH